MLFKGLVTFNRWLAISDFTAYYIPVYDLNTDHDCNVGVCVVAERERGSWSLVCENEEQWTRLAESIKDKTSPQDRHLFRIITQNFLPEISSMIEHKVRLETCTPFLFRGLKLSKRACACAHANQMETDIKNLDTTRLYKL